MTLKKNDKNKIKKKGRIFTAYAVKKHISTSQQMN